MLRLYPNSIRWRHVIAPLFVIVLLSLFFAGFIAAPAWALLGVVLTIYIAVIGAVGLAQAISSREKELAIGVPVAMAVMHLGWGGAFLWGIIRPRVSKGTSDG